MQDGPRTFATTRLIKLGDNDAAFDREEWQRFTMEERIAAVWELTLECLRWKDPNADEPRLQRSICRLERRGG